MLEKLLNSFQAVALIFVLMAVGWCVRKIKLAEKGTEKTIAKIVTGIAGPAFTVKSLYGLQPETLAFMAKGIALGCLQIVIMLLISFVLVWALKIPKSKRNVFCVIFAFSNALFVGVPVSRELFGEAGMPYAISYYISNTILFWTVGVFLLSAGFGSIRPKRLVTGLKNIITPPFISLAAMAVILLFKIPLPHIIIQPAEMLANLVTPLSLMFSGMVIYEIRLRKIKIDRGLIAVSAARFAAAPAIMYGICALTGCPPLMSAVMAVQAGMAVLIQASIQAVNYNADSQYAVTGFALTSALSFAAIPVYMMLLG